MSVRVLEGHVLNRLAELPDESVHCEVSSFPYWKLRAYQTEPQTWPDGWIGEWGQEPTPELYVDHCLMVSAALKRVLRRDGTFWLNLGPTYWNDPGGQNGSSGNVSTKAQTANRTVGRQKRGQHPVYKRKDLVLTPFLVAQAMQADGWILRSVICWHKLAAMPESVTDRPSSAWEPIFLFSRAERYYWDAEAVRQPHAEKSYSVHTTPTKGTGTESAGERLNAWLQADPTRGRQLNPSGASLKNVWPLPPEPLGSIAGTDHFAAFPRELVRRCLLAGTSERGVCPNCQAPWLRVVERAADKWNPNAAADRLQASGGALSGGTARSTLRVTGDVRSAMTGWAPSCRCPDAASLTPIAATVLDCCAGSGTTGLVADELGRDAVLVELKPEYAEMSRARIVNASPLFAEVECRPAEVSSLPLRSQLARAWQVFHEHGLTAAHLEAMRAAGITDTGKAAQTQTGAGANTMEVQRLASEAKASLRGYYRELLGKTIDDEPSCSTAVERHPAPAMLPLDLGVAAG